MWRVLASARLANDGTLNWALLPNVQATERAREDASS